MKRKHLSWNRPHEFEDDKENTIFFVVDYYQRAFALFHNELERSGYNSKIAHPIRKRFWGLLSYRKYSPIEITPFIQQYIEILEHELREIISKNSLAYWLHLYRRLFPEAIGLDTSPMVIGEIRATLESTIQKYAQFHPCDRIGITGQVEIGEVLGGLLMEPEFELERENLQSMKQLVLTDFTFTELRAFYDVERLAYELWRSSAMLRIVGKGSAVIVNDSDICIFDIRSDELSQLVKNFDDRYSKNSANFQLLSSKGVVFDVGKIPSGEFGGVFIPTYNLGNIPIKNFEFFFNRFEIDFSNNEMQTNFIWVPYSLRQYREAHTPFAEAFNVEYGVGLDVVLLVVAALCQRVFTIWTETEGTSIFRFWQRAYEGPYTRKYVIDEIQAFLPLAQKLLGIRKKHIDQKELHKAIHFWELDEIRRQGMDLAYSGPHSIFLPYVNDRLFIDYAWIVRRLYNLFVGVNIPDQNFKGEALEHLVRFSKSVLPPKGCKIENGEKKQVDASFKLGNRLVIVECKAIGTSIGFSRGDSQAIQYRKEQLDNALKQVDEKAQWLTVNPIGTNYDI